MKTQTKFPRALLRMTTQTLTGFAALALLHAAVAQAQTSTITTTTTTKTVTSETYNDHAVESVELVPTSEPSPLAISIRAMLPGVTIALGGPAPSTRYTKVVKYYDGGYVKKPNDFDYDDGYVAAPMKPMAPMEPMKPMEPISYDSGYVSGCGAWSKSGKCLKKY